MNHIVWSVRHYSMFNKFNPYKGRIYILVASLLWGTTGTVASFAPDVSPLAIGAFAMGVGGVLLVLNSFKELSRDIRQLRLSAKVFLLGGLSVALYPLAFYSAMSLSGVAIGTVVSIASAPFFAAFIERLTSNKLVSLKWMICFVIGSLGIVLLTLGKVHQPSVNNTSFEQNSGILLGLFAGLTYAIYSWSARHMINQGIDPKSAMAGMFGFAAILLLPSLAFTGSHLFSSANNTSVAIYMAVVPMFLGYLLFGYGLKQVEASTATLLTLLEPIVATLLAVVILGEIFVFWGWLGMGLILVCLLLQTLKVPFLKVGKSGLSKVTLRG
jgi:DME family drug/metabolite transporter